MKIHIDCIPCYFRQGLQAARFATDNQSHWWRTMHRLGDYIQSLTPESESHDVAEIVHRIIRESTECPDPYVQVKKDFNKKALDMFPAAEARVLEADNPLEAAVRMSIAGNVIDFGSAAFLDLDETMARIMDMPFAVDHREDFFKAVEAAENVLVLGDNTGEIVFDKLLLKQLAPRDITFVVRGAPILNDATPPDAIEAGVHELARIIDTGLPVPGLPLERMSQEFMAVFDNADLIISKGQANFESLSGCNLPNLFFMFTIKCDLVARCTGTSLADIVLIKGDRLTLKEV